MKTKKLFTTILIALVSLFGFGTALISAPTASAFTNPCDATLPPAVRAANGCGNSGDDTQTTLETTVADILNVVIGISGTIAVIFVVIGGVGYMTSSGDVGKAKKAKDTILYAAIGLVICALAYAIVNWVIVDVLKSGTAANPDTSIASTL